MKWQEILIISANRSKSLQPFVRIPKEELPHPSESGFRRDIGLPRFQIADWRYQVGQGCLHVVEYSDHYDIHWDRIDPNVSKIGHFWKDVVPGVGLFVFFVLILALLLFF